MWTFIANLWKQEIQSGNEQSRNFPVLSVECKGNWQKHTWVTQGNQTSIPFLYTCENKKVSIFLLICDPMYFVLVFSFR